MITENAELMKKANEALTGKWGTAIGAGILYSIIGGGPTAINIILSGPMAAGMAGFSLKYARKQEAEITDIFQGFNNFRTNLFAYIYVVVFIILWSLLLIIPGIIAAISYSQTFFILAEHPETEPIDAINQSKTMMDGYKSKYFDLCLRFLGWAILCIFTLGIGFFWLIPWMQVTFAMFYEDLKKLDI